MRAAHRSKQKSIHFIDSALTFINTRVQSLFCRA